MLNIKYIDPSAIVNVIGNIFNNPDLLSQEDKYHFIEEDFQNSFHRIVFSSIYNLYQLGNKKITIESIQDYLEQRPKALAEFKSNKGSEYILKCAESSDINTFPYYYKRLKKMSLLQAYHSLGFNLDWLYDIDNIFDSKKKQEQEDWLDNATLEEITDKINDKIDEIKLKYVENVTDEGAQMGDGVEELLESLKQTPALGYPFYSKYLNNITRGARLGKFYLRSAATGVGKSRSMIADACYWACGQMYNEVDGKWIQIGSPQPTLYIATEQDLSECQSMAISFLAGVDEEHILTGNYFAGEWDRVQKAAQILKSSKLYFECIPDFGLNDIENTIKKHIRENKIELACFDYIHTSPKILQEIGSKSGVKNLREDNILFLLSSGLKDICVKYGIFILSSTQLNGTWTESETPNQNLLRGSKAIADRLDVGMIMMDVTPEDIEKLKPLINKQGYEVPNIKLSIYKNRQGRWKDMYLWMKADKSCCKFNGLFATDWNYVWKDLGNPLKISVQQESIF